MSLRQRSQRGRERPANTRDIRAATRAKNGLSTEALAKLKGPQNCFELVGQFEGVIPPTERSRQRSKSAGTLFLQKFILPIITVL